MQGLLDEMDEPTRGEDIDRAAQHAVASSLLDAVDAPPARRKSRARLSPERAQRGTAKGGAGDSRADRELAAQVDFVRDFWPKRRQNVDHARIAEARRAAAAAARSMGKEALEDAEGVAEASSAFRVRLAAWLDKTDITPPQFTRALVSEGITPRRAEEITHMSQETKAKLSYTRNEEGVFAQGKALAAAPTAMELRAIQNALSDAKSRAREQHDARAQPRPKTGEKMEALRAGQTRGLGLSVPGSVAWYASKPQAPRDGEGFTNLADIPEPASGPPSLTRHSARGPRPDNDDTWGSLDSQILHVGVLEARSLPVMDSDSTDAYTSLRLEDDEGVLIEEHRTHTVHNSLAPCWNHGFRFALSERCATLVVSVYDHDEMSFDDQARGSCPRTATPACCGPNALPSRLVACPLAHGVTRAAANPLRLPPPRSG